MMAIPLRIWAFTVLSLFCAARASAQSVLIDELAVFKAPFNIVEGAVVQLADGSIYGLYTGGINGGIYRVSPDGAGGYATTLVYEFEAGQPSPVAALRRSTGVSDLMEAGPDGNIYFATLRALLRFDPVAGSVDTLHTLPDGWPSSVIAGADGHTIFGSVFDGAIYSYDTTTGDFRVLNNTGSELTGLQQMPDGNLVAVHDGNSPTAQLHRVDPFTGAVTASIVRGNSTVMPPSRGEDGEIYVQLSDFGDRYTYRLDASCFCLQTLHLIPWPNNIFASTIAGARGGYLYINFGFNPHRLNLNVSPAVVERIATDNAFNYQLLPDGTLVMFNFEETRAIARAINTNTIVPGTEAVPVAFTTPIINDGTSGFPLLWTEAPDGMLYGLASSTAKTAAMVRIDPMTKERAVVAQIDLSAFNPLNSTVRSSKMVLTPEGRLFGTLAILTGGFSAIFSFDPATHALELVKTFPVNANNIPGPDGALVTALFLGSDGWLYGGTRRGNDPETDFGGSFFKIDPTNGSFVTIARPAVRTFNPGESMVEAAPGMWYANYFKSETSCGNIGRLDASTGEFTEVRTFVLTFDGKSDPCLPGGLTRAQDGTIYGIFADRGPEAVPGDPNSRGAGGIFSLDGATGVITTLHMFRVDGDVRLPIPDVIAAPDGMLYAGFTIRVTPSSNFRKGIVRIDPATGAATKLAELPDPRGTATGFLLGSDGRFYGGQTSPGRALSIAVLDAIPVAPASGPFGGTTAISATLKAIGVPLAGRTISFTLNGAAIGSAMTNPDGVATLDSVSLAGIAIGTHSNAIGASFAGDEFFPATSGTGSVTVVDVPTPGLVIGVGFIRAAEAKHEFSFAVHESAAGVNRGVFELRSKRKQASDDRFATDDITSVWFGEDAVMFAGPGVWNGQTGYRFEAVATGRTRLAVTIYDPAGTIVASLDDEIDGGTIVRLKPR